jgi:hypothetical protein
MFALVAAGCAAVPDADDEIAEATATFSARPSIQAADGTLNPVQSNRLLSSVASDPGTDGLLETHLAVE